MYSYESSIMRLYRLGRSYLSPLLLKVKTNVKKKLRPGL